MELRTEIGKGQRKGQKKVGCDVGGIRYHAQAVKENAALKGRLLCRGSGEIRWYREQFALTVENSRGLFFFIYRNLRSLLNKTLGPECTGLSCIEIKSRMSQKESKKGEEKWEFMKNCRQED